MDIKVAICYSFLNEKFEMLTNCCVTKGIKLCYWLFSFIFTGTSSHSPVCTVHTFYPENKIMMTADLSLDFYFIR